MQHFAHKEEEEEEIHDPPCGGSIDSQNAESEKAQTVATNKRLRTILWCAIGLGMAIRLSLPFFDNPMDHLSSDWLRHYSNALDVRGEGIATITDSPGYELWRSAVIRIANNSRLTFAAYAGILSALTPWFWYRWMRDCLPTKNNDASGYAILSLLPTWIGIYSFFAQETLLLPLLGLSLWLSFRAVSKKSLPACAVAALAWSCSDETHSPADRK